MEKINKMKKKAKRYLKKTRQTINKYVLTNRLFMTYFLFSLIGCIILRDVTIDKSFNTVSFATELGMILLVGAFGYFINPKNQYKYFQTWLIIFTIMQIANSVYYTFYASFASLGELATLKQAETVTDSIFNELRLLDFIYIVFPVLFYYIHKGFRKTSYYNYMSKIENGKRMFIGTLIASIILVAYSFINATGTDYSRLSKQWNRVYIVERFGIVLYQANDIVQTIKPKISSLFGYEEAKKIYDDYFANEENLKYNNDNKYTGILEGYNVVYVHMESVQNFLMNQKFNGEEVTPNLNKLAKEGMFFSNFYPQISTGTSSDAEYIMLTGLLPSSSGTVFVSYPDNKFVSIATLLKEKNYHTFSMHGNYASMWNRSKVHPNLGYEEMIFRDQFEYDELTQTVGLGINDKDFFAQGLEKLVNMENTYDNYFGTIITLSNHSPFKHNEIFDYDLSVTYTDEETKEEKTTCYLCEENIGDYLVSSHYSDEALGEFINYIKESESFNNTLFVFYGDHDAKFSQKDINYLYNYDFKTGKLKDSTDPTYVEYDNVAHNLNKKTPLIFWTKNNKLKYKLRGEIKNVMGMYDTMPTLLNMLNIDYDLTLGHDIFNIKEDNYVVFPNGNYLTNKIYYNNSTGVETKVSDKDVDEEYITKYKEQAELELSVSNAIIMYDLRDEEQKGEN